MILDITGIELLPGNGGKDCLGNGDHVDINGNPIEICCDECEYLLCCISEIADCENCSVNECPRKQSF